MQPNLQVMVLNQRTFQSKNEIGDVLFSVLAVAESLDIDADEALDVALEKYERRINQKGDPGSE